MGRKAKQSTTSLASKDGTGLDDTARKILAMLTALEDEDRLSEWEVGFIANITDRFLDGKSFTPAQYDRLEIIYRKFN